MARSGLTAENTIYGQSICPDEINNEKGDLATLMADHWGECFPMGGIGGAPFVGKTGFGAFSHHVPDDGHIIILFGPHIAISDEGELGKYLREGQVHESTACGAVSRPRAGRSSMAHHQLSRVVDVVRGVEAWRSWSRVAQCGWSPIE